MRHLWVDTAYQERFKEWVEQALGWTVWVVRRPRRWVVERALGWLGRWRRTSTDYECLPETSQHAIYLTMIRVMLRRLAES